MTNIDRTNSPGYSTILVAFAIKGENEADRQNRLMELLPKPADQGGSEDLDCWWLAVDNSADGSDNAPAVFVPEWSGEGNRQLTVGEAWNILTVVSNVLNQHDRNEDLVSIDPRGTMRRSAPEQISLSERQFFANADHEAADRSDSLLRWANGGAFVHTETGSATEWDFHLSKIYISGDIVAQYASENGDPWVTESRNFTPGWYLVKTNSDGLVWGYRYASETYADSDFDHVNQVYSLFLGE